MIRRAMSQGSVVRAALLTLLLGPAACSDDPPGGVSPRADAGGDTPTLDAPEVATPRDVTPGDSPAGDSTPGDGPVGDGLSPEVSGDVTSEDSPPTDARGDVATGTDVTPPRWPDASLRASELTATTALLTWSAATDEVGVTSYRLFRDGALAGMTDAAARSLRVTGLTRGTRYLFRVQAGDAAENLSTDGPSAMLTTATEDVFLPTPVDGTVATGLSPSIDFLYTGPEAPQRGLMPGTLDPGRIAVVRGLVQARGGSPSAGVSVAIADHPEFGGTTTRADGTYDLVVNAGVLTVSFTREGAVSLQRRAEVRPEDITVLPDVVVTPLDARATPVNLSATDYPVAQGNPVTDASGTRTAALLFAPGTLVTLSLPGGGSAPVATPTVRVSELSWGSDGPAALPAELPAPMAYTYAFEVTVDEAARAMATRARFSAPAVLYVDNFVGFAAGTTLPVGSYDRARHAWTPSRSALALRVLGSTLGLADLDADNNGVADSPAALAALGITEGERRRLAALAPAPRSVLRALVSESGAFALGPAMGRPADAITPAGAVPPVAPCALDDPAVAEGSILGVENQSLGETLPLAGTPFSLRYQSDRTPGGAGYAFELPLSGPSVPPSLRGILVEATLAGTRVRRSFPPTANQVFSYHWDGRDVYGRSVQGARTILVRVGYVYDGSYRASQRLGSAPGIPLMGTRTRTEAIDWSLSYGQVGSWNNRLLGLGGWDLDARQSYDPSGHALVLGDGRRRSACSTRTESIETFAGTGSLGLGGDGPAASSELNQPRGLAPGNDGSVYLVDTGNHRLRRVAPDGSIGTVAGTASPGFSGDGGPAARAQLNEPWGVAVTSDGSVYVTDARNHRVRRIDPDGTISTVAGTGSPGFSGDGALATAAQINSPRGIAALPDGTFFFADNGNRRIRQVTPDGLIFTVAGNGNGVPALFGTPSVPQGGPATDSAISDPQGVALGPDGSLYFTDTGISYVRRVDPAGIMRTVGGSGNLLFPGFGGDDGPALVAQFNNPQGLTVGSDGVLYISDTGNGRVRRVRGDGVINTVAGGGTVSRDGAPGAQVSLGAPVGVLLGLDGTLFLSEASGSRVRRVKFTSLPGPAEPPAILPSDDRSELYVFDSRGRHLRTLGALTGAVRWRFDYDSSGRISALTDADGNATLIERDPRGALSAIVGPYGHRTVFTDAGGDLASATDPTGGMRRYVYAPGALLTSFTDPRGGVTRFGYDPDGRLLTDTNPLGDATSLSRVVSVAGGVTVRRSSSLGRVNTYATRTTASGEQQRVLTSPSGQRASFARGADSASTERDPNGLLSRTVQGPDPRFGMQSPIMVAQTLSYPGGRRRETSHARTASLAVARDPLSLVTLSETTTRNGHSATRSYDAATRALSERSAEGRVTVTRFDPRDHVLDVTRPGELTLSYAYDSRGRLAAMMQGGRRVELAYDTRGNVASQTDALGRVERFEYDAYGRVTRRVYAGGREVTLSYDSAGNITSLSTPGGGRHSFTYTAANDLSSRALPAVGAEPNTTRVTLDADRNVTRVTRADGSGLDYLYDAGGRLSGMTLGRGTTRLAYDPTTGQATTLTAPDGGTVSFRYDGDLVTAVTWSGSVRGSVEYTYDGDLRRASETVNGLSAVARSYDNDDLLTRAGALVLTRDRENGRLTGTSLAGVATADGYNPLGELVSQRATTALGVVFDIALSRDAMGRITASTEALEGEASVRYGYVYDAAGRLTEVTRGGAVSESYAYDANGNRTRYAGLGGAGARAGSYDPQDRLVRYGDASYTYTAAGDLTTRSDGAGATSYAYDEMGNLLRVVLPDARVLSYTVDAGNRRVGKSVGGRLTQGFLYEGLLPVAELDGSNAVLSRFVYATRSNVPDYMVRGASTYRILVDSRGSARLVIDASTGAVAQRVDYDAFGRVVREVLGPGFAPIPFGFGGGLYDRDTGLVRFGARDYDPETGRFTTQDPVGLHSDETNLYGYALADPVNEADPEGLTEGITYSFIIKETVIALAIEVIGHFVCGLIHDHSLEFACKVGVHVATVVATAGAPAAAAAAGRGARLFGDAALQWLARGFVRSTSRSVQANGARLFLSPAGHWLFSFSEAATALMRRLPGVL